MLLEPIERPKMSRHVLDERLDDERVVASFTTRDRQAENLSQQ